jgi:AraC-like DNA-binding protein
MLLKDPDRPCWSISHVELGGVHVQIASLGSGTITEGASWSDGYLLYLPLTGSRAHIANAEVIDKHSILVLKPGSDFCLSVKGPHKWCTIFVPTQILARGGDPLNLSTIDEKATCRVIRLNPQLAGQVKSFIKEIEFAALSSLDFEATPAATIAAAQAVKLVSLVVAERQDGEPERDGRPRFSRQEIIRRCKGLREERRGKRVKVGEMAARAGVSERTLQTAFKEYFGVGPTRYLQLMRLWQIRSALRMAQTDRKTVTEILADYGEYEFGRFAARYRQLYGELPSQTLRVHRR